MKLIFQKRELFEKDTKLIIDLKLEINKTDREIDKILYKPYSLNDDEIALVESA